LLVVDEKERTTSFRSWVDLWRSIDLCLITCLTVAFERIEPRDLSEPRDSSQKLGFESGQKRRLCNSSRFHVRTRDAGGKPGLQRRHEPNDLPSRSRRLDQRRTPFEGDKCSYRGDHRRKSVHVHPYRRRWRWSSARLSLRVWVPRHERARAQIGRSPQSIKWSREWDLDSVQHPVCRVPMAKAS
jgi:hypothetical protein